MDKGVVVVFCLVSVIVGAFALMVWDISHPSQRVREIVGKITVVNHEENVFTISMGATTGMGMYSFNGMMENGQFLSIWDFGIGHTYYIKASQTGMGNLTIIEMREV